MPRLSQRFARTLLHAYPFRRGQGRLIDRTRLGRMAFDTPIIDVGTQHGFRMRVNPNDLIGRHLYYTGQFDRTIVDVIHRYAKPGDRILDIGANIGYVSCCLLSAVPDSIVVAIEPQQQVYEMLKQNVETVAPDRVRVIRAAISATCGTGRMVAHAANTGGGHLVSDGQTGDASVEQVELIDGRTLMARAGVDRVNMIKIDVEGHELPVLRGLRSIIDEHRPRLVLFECFDELTESHGISQFWQSVGYDVAGIRKSLLSWTLVPLERLRAEGRRAHDYVARPKDASASN